MVDQDEIERQVYSWLLTQSEKALDDPNDVYERWEQFVASHDDETAEALRRSATFEIFRLLDALLRGVRDEIRTGVPLDESIIEHFRQGGSPSFTGDREQVRLYFAVAPAAFKRLSTS